MMRIVVAGTGNVLRRDDGFGVVVAQRLLAGYVPPGVDVLEVGIGGIHLVQDLLSPTDGLVVVDATEAGRPPGTLVVMRPEVLDVTALAPADTRDRLADMHFATPERALMLAHGLGVLPPQVWVVGCQPLDADELGEGLSEPVTCSVEPAVTEVKRIVTDMGIPWS